MTAFAPTLDASTQFPTLVAAAQRADREGVAHLWLAGPEAAPVAARLLRLVRHVRIGVAVVPDGDLDVRTLVLDAVALAGIAGGIGWVLVPDGVTQVRVAAAVRAELARGPRPYPAHFGGDAFAATIRLPWPVDVVVLTAALAGARAA